jgi:hypothetical protein
MSKRRGRTVQVMSVKNKADRQGKKKDMGGEKEK